MKATVGLSRRALQDADEITAWYLERSGDAAVANTWVDGLFALIDELADSFDTHPEAREAESLSGDVREVYYGSGHRLTHRIVYEINGNHVYVLRTRHHSQRDLTADDVGH